MNDDAHALSFGLIIGRVMSSKSFLLKLAITALCLNVISVFANGRFDLQHYKDYVARTAPGLNVIDLVPIKEADSVILITGRGTVINMDSKRDIVYAGDVMIWRDDGFVNLTKQKLVERIGDVPLSEVVFYPAKVRTNSTIDVFFDIDCAYCRLLYEEIEEINSHGVAVRLHAYPASGPLSDTGKRTAQIWCEPDAKKRLDHYIHHNEVLPNYVNEQSCTQKIQEQYMLGRTIDIPATPAVTFPNGRIVFSYMEARQIVEFASEK